MCGRFTQYFSWQEVRDFMDLTGPAPNLSPRYNLAPSQDAAVVREREGERALDMVRWGLVPFWSKDVKIGYKLINARSETVQAKPSFRAAYRSRRCLVPVDGYYEWTRRGSTRQAWLIGPAKGGLIALAGLWERWIMRDGTALPKSLTHLKPGDPVETFTILTAPAGGNVASIHHRMPVVLPPEAHDAWLQAKPVPLDGLPHAAMSVLPVSSHVNKPSNDDPLCIEAVHIS